MPIWVVYAIIGTIGGIAAGFFGIGGGIVIIPALIYLAGFTQHMATGTTLALLLPPVGLAAAYEYYRNGNINIEAAIIIAITMFWGSWAGARFANQVSGPHLRLIFGIFTSFLGFYLVYAAIKKMG